MPTRTHTPGGRPAGPDGWDARKAVLLTNRYGLHMRPSKQVVELANSFPCDIVLSAAGQEVDAKSILGLIGLGAECGVDVEVRARGDRAEEAVDRIVALLASLPELHGEPRDTAASPDTAAPDGGAGRQGQSQKRTQRRGGTAKGRDR